MKIKFVQSNETHNMKYSMKALSIFVLVIAVFTMPSCELLQGLAIDTKNVDTKADDAEMQLRVNIVDYGKRYVGTKYKYAGKQPQTGFDCSGFTSYVFKEYDINLSSSSSYQSQQGQKVALNNVKPGDLVFFSRDGKTIMHVALVVDNNSDGIFVVHSTSSKGVIIQNITQSNYWKPKILFAKDVINN